jgi:hypothetical protein
MNISLSWKSRRLNYRSLIQYKHCWRVLCLSGTTFYCWTPLQMLSFNSFFAAKKEEGIEFNAELSFTNGCHFFLRIYLFSCERNTTSPLGDFAFKSQFEILGRVFKKILRANCDHSAECHFLWSHFVESLFIQCHFVKSYFRWRWFWLKPFFLHIICQLCLPWPYLNIYVLLTLSTLKYRYQKSPK